ncbi:MAG: 50S ribosomal protein L23 [Tractidigestivibacter sp.]|jgi:large subunit ribosomal protein L23|uniref:50S ribosomal protein L23 n=1 Tax=Tractidigestivibacter sp. TaxID=2847320 RepID=UPI003D8CE112
MQSAYDVIIRPIVSERSYGLMEEGKYTFEVAKKAPKEEIADAVEKLFGVHVLKVNTINVHSKSKRVRYQMGKTRSWKKAIVTLAPGEQIEIFANQQAASDSE